MHLNFSFPQLRILAGSLAFFALQIALFLAADYQLYQIPFQKLGMMTATEAFLWVRYFPALEVGLFAITTALLCAMLFAIPAVRKTINRKRVLACGITELLVFSGLGLLSMLDYSCSSLFSTLPNDYTIMPSCGYSSLNVTNAWFAVAAFLTVVLWSFIVSETGKFAFTLSLRRKES